MVGAKISRRKKSKVIMGALKRKRSLVSMNSMISMRDLEARERVEEAPLEAGGAPRRAKALARGQPSWRGSLLFYSSLRRVLRAIISTAHLQQDDRGVVRVLRFGLLRRQKAPLGRRR